MPVVGDGVVTQKVIEGASLGIAINQVVRGTKPIAYACIPGARGGIELAQVVGEARSRQDVALGKDQLGEGHAIAKERVARNRGHDPTGEVDGGKVDVALEETGEGVRCRDVEATTIKGEKTRVVLEPGLQAGGGDRRRHALVVGGANGHGGDGGLVNGGKPRKLVGGGGDGLRARSIHYIYK